jgi:hypothetical protein
MKRIGALLLAAGCSDGTVGPYLEPVSPFPCEDNLDSAPIFTIPFDVDGRTLDAMRQDPPIFQLIDGTTLITTTTAIVDAVGITITPDDPLLPDREFTLELVDRAGLGPDTVVPAMFPARFTTRNRARIRVVRALAGRVVLSFSQALDPATVAANVTVPASTGPATYFDTAFHQVYVETADSDQPITVTFGPGLRTAMGLAVTVDPITFVPRDTTFVAEGCFYP